MKVTSVSTEGFLIELERKMRSGAEFKPCNPVLKKCSHPGVAAVRFARQLSDPPSNDYAPPVDTAGYRFR